MTGILGRLVSNSQAAIDDGIYDTKHSMRQSETDFVQTIKNDTHTTLLAEIKFASPSLGRIRAQSEPADIARQMVSGGASALSVLTQPNMFCGHPEYLVKVRQATDVPILMKDIMIDKVQIDAAQSIGADYILVIQSLYEEGYLRDIDEFISYAHKRNLGVLLEVHTRQEFKKAQETKADILGINNRNLDTLEIDIKTTASVLDGFSPSRPILSESGIETAEDISYLKGCGADAFLVGSSIMKSNNIQEHVKRLVNAF